MLRRGDSDNSDKREVEGTEASSASEEAPIEQVGTGRPTPKRRAAEAKRRGPVAPAPRTAKEARARRKATRGSKEDRKAEAAERRASSAARRARMLAGADKYLLPRDKGPVRAYVRDFIDARRNLVGLFMPLALILIMTMFVTPALQQIVTLAMLVMMLFMVGEGIWLGRMINNRVAERFPDSTDGGFKLGWYAFVRASQIRKLRAPKPRGGRGAAMCAARTGKQLWPGAARGRVRPRTPRIWFVEATYPKVRHRSGIWRQPDVMSPTQTGRAGSTSTATGGLPIGRLSKPQMPAISRRSSKAIHTQRRWSTIWERG